MISNGIKSTLSCLLVAGIMTAGVGVAGATPDDRDFAGVGVEMDNLTPEQVEDVMATAELMEKIDTASTPEEKERVFYETLGSDGAKEAAEAVGLTPEELFSNETVNDGTGFRSTGEFLTCMKGEVTDDLKSIFDVNAIAALIGQEKYVEAAEKAVKYLAKQGVKRNAVGLAATLVYYGGKCAFFRD